MPKRKQRLAKIASLVVESNQRRKDSRQFERDKVFEYDKEKKQIFGTSTLQERFCKGYQLWYV